MTKYIAKYNGKTTDIEIEDGLWEAKQLAIKEMKVPKSKQGLLSVHPESFYTNQNFRYL